MDRAGIVKFGIFRAHRGRWQGVGRVSRLLRLRRLVGSAEKVTGSAATEATIEDRLSLMRRAMDRMFQGRDEFGASWTYVTAEPS